MGLALLGTAGLRSIGVAHWCWPGVHCERQRGHDARTVIESVVASVTIHGFLLSK